MEHHEKTGSGFVSFNPSSGQLAPSWSQPTGGLAIAGRRFLPWRCR